MVFAAGKGTRLHPITQSTPKALVQVGGVPLLEIALRRLKIAGVTEVVINVHHLVEQVMEYVDTLDLGLSILISDERKKLLDTGGGLKKAAPLLKGSPFFLINADVLTNLDLGALYETHLRSPSLATLAVRNRESSRYLLFDESAQLVGWRNSKTKEERWSRKPNSPPLQLAFSGIQVIDPKLFEFFPDKEIFSTIELFLQAAKSQPVYAYRHDADFWLDVGRVPDLERAKRLAPQILEKLF